MNFWIIGILFMSFFSSSKEQKNYKVTGKINYTQDYCGGAQPTEEILKAMRTPQKLQGKKIYVRKGKVNAGPIIAEATTDSTGTFQVKLPNGIYCIVSENKKDKIFYQSILEMHSKQTEFYQAVDKNCLDEWYQKPDLVFEVKSKPLMICHTYNIPCSWNKVPCATYTGPMPP